MEEEQGSKKVRSLGIIDSTHCVHIKSSGEKHLSEIHRAWRKNNVWTCDYFTQGQEFIMNARRTQNIPSIPFQRKKSALQLSYLNSLTLLSFVYPLTGHPSTREKVCSV